MYGLFDTDTKYVLNDIKNILELSPKHISTYALSLEENTPLFSQREKYNFPDEDKQLEMYLSICDALSKEGFSHYEISNFAHIGFESKHNLGYWERREYIGLGSGAHSFWDNKRFFSKSDRNAFIKDAFNCNFDIALGLDNAEHISEREKKEEEIMLALRTSKGIKLPSLSDTTKKMIESKLATYKNGYFSLTDEGYFVSNSIIYYLCKELLYDKQ
jgi:oxygen-independent coproporphyrinogen-3 oxidase